MSEKLTCPACGYPNDPDADACENCGAELIREEPAEVAPEVAQPEEPVEAAPPAPEPAKPRPAKTQPQKKQQPRQQQQRKQAALQPELFVRDGMVRIQLKLWQALAFGFLGIAAIVLIISYIMDSGASQPTQVVQQQMAPQGQQAPQGPTLEQINAARAAVDANPNDPTALLKLSHLLHDAEMFDQAIVMYQRYMQIVPDNPDAQVDLGVCYYSLGQFDAAIKEMKEAVARHPDHQLGHFNLGIVTLAKGDTAEARNWMSKTISLNPGTQIAGNAEAILSRIQPGS